MLWVFVVWYFLPLLKSVCYKHHPQPVSPVILPQQDSLAYRKLQLKHWQIFAATFSEGIYGYLKKANIHICICLCVCAFIKIYIYICIHTHTHTNTQCKKKRGETGEFAKWWLSSENYLNNKTTMEEHHKAEVLARGIKLVGSTLKQFAADIISIWSESKATDRMK